MDVARQAPSSVARCAAPLADVLGRASRERELLLLRADRATTASPATARPRRSSPTTASRSSACAAALERLRAGARAAATGASGAAAARRLPRAPTTLPQALAAVDLALWDRAGRPRGPPVAALLTDEPRAAVPVNATIARRATARAPPTQAAAAARDGFGCVKVKVGIGDDAGRRRRGARPRPAPTSRCAWTRTAPGTSTRRVPPDRRARAGRARARRGAGPRARGHARGARARRGARSRSTRRRPSPGRSPPAPPTRCA